MFDYEWDVETTDEYDNIEHQFCTTAREAVKKCQEIGGEIVLVWSEGDDFDGVRDRAWAYVRGSRLPEYFEKPMGDVGEYAPVGQRVPKRFHQELAKALEGRL